MAVLLLCGARSMGQTYEIIPHIASSTECMHLGQIMQQRNGDLVTSTLLMNCGETGADPPTSVGTIFHKVSRQGIALIDTLYMDCVVPPDRPQYYMMAQDPSGEGNISAGIETDGYNNWLRISRFTDESLEVMPEQDITVPLPPGELFDHPQSVFLDHLCGDLWLRYNVLTDDMTYNRYVERYGLDGTLKNRFIDLPFEFNRTFGVFHDEPMEMFLWDGGHSSVEIEVFDEDFNLIDSFHIDTIVIPDSIPVEPGKDTVFLESRMARKLVVDDEDIVIASDYLTFYYGQPYEEWEEGVAVMRYDKRKHTLKAIRFFESPMAQIVGLENTGDGGVYLVYREQWHLLAMKLDEALEDIWSLQIPFSNSASTFTSSSIQLGANGDGHGIAVFGSSYDDETDTAGCFYLIVNDEMWGVGESAPEVRPYAYWPNPAKDALHLQYSPDVKPTQIELYDLQGRLVRSQRNGLETLSLQGLAPGTYTMRVALEDGTVFTDKVVKE